MVQALEQEADEAFGLAAATSYSVAMRWSIQRRT